MSRVWILLSTWLVACGGRGPLAGAPVPTASEPIASSEWSIAYHRHCEGSMTPPVLASSGQFAFCNARFDVEHGHFRGLVDLGLVNFVDDARGIFASPGGLRLGRIVKGVSPSTLAVSEGGDTETAVLSPNRTEIASFEGSMEVGALVVREFPSLRTVRSTPVPRIASPTLVGWLADGREIVFGSQAPCGARGCPSTLLVVERGSLTPLGPPFDQATAIALDARGERAVIASPVGIRVVALPTGETLSEVEGSPREVRRLAISEDGKRVAVAGPHVVTIHGASPRSSALRREHEVAIAAETILFSPNGKTLLAGQGTAMLALQSRAPAPSRAAPTIAYAPRLPPNFETAEKTPREEGQPGDTFAFGADSRGEPGLFAWYRKRDHSVDVVASSFEASELDDVKEMERWARLIALRFGMTDAIDASGWRVWQDDKQRSVTMVRRVREGCDPHDAWVRFTERGGVLYRVSVDTAPGTAAKSIAPLARAFLFEPFGDGVTTKLSFRLPRVPWLPGPC